MLRREGFCMYAYAEYASERLSRISWNTMEFMEPPKYSLYNVLAGSAAAS